MTVDTIIDGILEREQENGPDYLSPDDSGGRTTWGISEKSFPEEWLHGPPTKARARVIYHSIFVPPFDVLTGHIDDRIRVALIDDAVMSGPDAAIKRFQTVLGVARDGIIGPATLAVAMAQDGNQLLKRYVVERAFRICRLVQARPKDLTNLAGWIDRILKFLP